MKRIAAIFLVLVLAFALFACGAEDADDNGGNGGNGEAKVEEVKGASQSWGKISVFVPEGCKLNPGSITGVDDTDENQCYIQKDVEIPSMYDYVWIVVSEDEAAVAANVETTKTMNAATDATVGEWKGCTYEYTLFDGSKTTCGMLYRTVDGVTYQLSFAGYPVDSPVFVKILDSIKAAQ